MLLQGTVIVWDTVTAQKTSVFQEHEKRCWYVLQLILLHYYDNRCYSFILF